MGRALILLCQTSTMNPPFRPRLVTFFVSCTLPIAFDLCVSPLFAQAQSDRLVHVTVTDPRGRFVTGLEQEHFAIIENGVNRRIINFSDVTSPISVAIVSETQLDAGSFSSNNNDELIQTRSVSDALQQLSASKNLRKALVVTTAVDTQAIPAGIQVVQAALDNIQKVVVELHNEYLLQFESANASTGVEVSLKPPRGLPPLRSNLK